MLIDWVRKIIQTDLFSASPVVEVNFDALLLFVSDPGIPATPFRSRFFVSGFPELEVHLPDCRQ